MERGGASRWLLIIAFSLLSFLAFQQCSKEKEVVSQPLGREFRVVPESRAPEAFCDLWTAEFHAKFSTHGASLTHFELLTAKYRKDQSGLNLATAKDEFRRSLNLQWRNVAAHDLGGAPWQVAVDSLDWKIERADGKSCVFVYEDAEVKVTKALKVTERPYEVELTGQVENKASEARRHALTVDTADWKLDSEVQGHMLRQSPFITHVECIGQNESATRLHPSDFEPDEFSEPPFAKNPVNEGDWHQAPETPSVAAVSNFYFTHALHPVKSAVQPVCQLQIELWQPDAKKGESYEPGAMYRARMAYPVVTLEPGKSAEYQLLAFIGPKESNLIAQAGGEQQPFKELIDLGFFAVIAKLLVAFLFKVYSYIPNWGIAIIILTITARLLLFPLNVPMIKNAMKMRELKPEMDALNEKFKNDPQAKGLAQMELWRKHKVNPFKGCLPQLAAMPVWFALYTTLQRAVELYNIPFLWFPDLSEPDPYFALPFVIGAIFFVQQKLMPQQGDPTQQKMMLYFMPGMFTVFMLFLPAGLGVYMFTNSLLGILQQVAVERHSKKRQAQTMTSEGGVTIVETTGTATKSSKKSKKSQA